MDGIGCLTTRRRGSMVERDGLRSHATSRASRDFPANLERLITCGELLLFGMRYVSRSTGELRPLTSKHRPC